jgi:1-acyl-sn-glycerol-3-phosphate acyltransferase
MARTIRGIVRSAMIVVLLSVAVLHGKLLKRLGWMVPGPDGAAWAHRWCRRILWALGIECEVDGSLPDAGGGMLAVVSNHMTYLDVLLYSAIRPFVMVSKSEVRRWPLIGWITAQAGTVYLQRAASRSPRTQTQEDVNALMAAAFRSGLPVLFFPEGTTGDGSGILPFRRGLFNSVVEDKVPVRVAAMRWELARPNPGASVANDVCFVGDAEFAPHLFGFLGLAGVKVRVRFGEEILRSDDRLELAEMSRDRMVGMWQELGGPSHEWEEERNTEVLRSAQNDEQSLRMG